MKHMILAAALAVGLPALALAQTSQPGRPSPGPTSDPATPGGSGQATHGNLPGTAGITSDVPQPSGSAPVPVTPPSGAPPDVMITPK